MKVTGSIEVSIPVELLNEDEKRKLEEQGDDEGLIVEIAADDFSLEECDDRHIGDGDYQTEALWVASDYDNRFKVILSAAELQGSVHSVSVRIEGEAEIVDDENLNVVPVKENDGYDDDDYESDEHDDDEDDDDRY
ncbi:hypothetical protein [Atlantibacter sp.]|uniref:hypothetical protein n=1 Tax=Atlantibacter sp. TaxID=1903473 RepID=UPI0028AA9144|nr:hypothetical protein [Atlantibacter sp.]